MSSAPVPQHATFGSLGSVCRLGLATRGGTHLTIADVQLALDKGINFLNWPGTPDALSQTIAQLGPRRQKVIVCVQFEARTARDADSELSHILRALNTDYVDLLTFYYVEEPGEWRQIIAPGGVLEFCRRAQQQGKVRMLGLTSHQRLLAAEIARGGLIDMLMIRYNAAHRGAEVDIFPVTDALKMPVVAYTGLRWKALLESTPDDPAGFQPPPAPQWYRFELQNPAVTVALMAPDTRQELEENLTLFDSWHGLPADEYQRLAQHGQRVRRHAGKFP